MMANLNGSQPRILISSGLNLTEGLAWDWLNEKLYWTDTYRKIEVYDISSGLRKKLIDTGPDSTPRGIVLDPYNRYMYWTDWGSPAKIERASMDGTARETLHNTALIWPNDIAIDCELQIIYWMDASLDKLESSHVTGSNRRVLSRELISRPFSLAVHNGTVYWSDWGYTRVIYASLSSTADVFGIVPVLPSNPTGVRIVALDAQPINSPNPCSVGNGGCSHLCLLSISGGRSCNCPTGLILANDGVNCTGGVTVTITGSPIDIDYFTGLQLTLTCLIHIPLEMSSLPITVSAEWSKSGSTLLSSSHVSVQQVPERVGFSVYQTNLVFSSLDGSRGDEGNYTCTVIVVQSGSTISTASATTNVVIPTTFFQLMLYGVTDCLSWRSHTTSAKVMDIVEAIIDNVVLRCGCNFTEDQITDRVLQCFPSSPNMVTYHAQLHGTLQANVSQLVTALQDWVSSVTSIPVQFLPLSMIGFCTVTSSSLLELCPGAVLPTSATMAVTTTTSETTTKQSMSSDNIGVTSSNPTSVIAAAAAVFVIVVLVVYMGFIALVVFMAKRGSRHSSVDIRENDAKHLTPGMTVQPTYCLALDDPSNHQYEEIKDTAWSPTGEAPPKYSEKDFNISQCPAYTSTLKAACPPEVQYEEIRTVTVQGQRAMFLKQPADYEVMQTPSTQGQRSATGVNMPRGN